MQKQRFTDIDVERINVVNPEGTLSLVIANRERLPGGIFDGKWYGKRGNTGASSSREGDESGRLIHSTGRNEDGTLKHARRHLSWRLNAREEKDCTGGSAKLWRSYLPFGKLQINQPPVVLSGPFNRTGERAPQHRPECVLRIDVALRHIAPVSQVRRVVGHFAKWEIRARRRAQTLYHMLGAR